MRACKAARLPIASAIARLRETQNHAILHYTARWRERGNTWIFLTLSDKYYTTSLWKGTSVFPTMGAKSQITNETLWDATCADRQNNNTDARGRLLQR